MRKELLEYFNRQINREFYSGYLYYAFSTCFDEIMMQGFSMYMKHLSSMELKYAQKMYDYLVLRDEKLSFLKIDEPICGSNDVSGIFAQVLIHEHTVIYETEKLIHLAKKYNDKGAEEFIKEILNQKTKNLSDLRKIVFEIKNSDNALISVNSTDNLIKA